MVEYARMAALTGYLPLMQTLGVDPRPLLREFGIPADLFNYPEQLLPVRAGMRLLERSAELTGCASFGLRMAEQRSTANLGVSSLVIAHQPTLGDVLQALGDYRNRINSTLVLHVEQMGEEVVVRENLSLNPPEPMRQSTDLAVGVLARLFCSVLGESWSPLSVCFAHEPPAEADMALVRRLFRCEPDFDCEFDGIVVRATDLSRPNLTANVALADHARDLIDSVLAPALRTTTQNVEQLILLFLPTGRATIENCAASMGVTARTLQRQLAAESSNFSDILNATRMQLSAQYLGNPRMRITDVAELLGYGSIGAFTRWHGQAFGQSPRQWRQSRTRAAVGGHARLGAS